MQGGSTTYRDFHAMSAAATVSYRRSGLLIAGIMAALFGVLAARGKPHPALLIAAVLTAAGAWFELGIVRKAVDLLIRAGHGIGRVTNPVLFGLIYLLAAIPTALVLRLSGKDVLDLRTGGERTSYWKSRSGGQEWKGSFRNQF